MNSKPIQSAFLAIAATVTLVAGAVSPALARADDPTKAAKQADDQSEAAMQKRYCVQGVTTGTMMPKRECHTRAEWIARTGIDPAKEVRKN
ncbi:MULTISPECIES: hypothetical protein [unclassified Sphingomonas]|jgi:hypothetical protein|uniref:hypothetical protein n=1 Tax=unclassified Sphingomonas TaxID=196159 RepID=UPI0010F46311|nr:MULTISPECIES: hypothetical protein [unclassified Sphingomonas]